MSNDKYRWWCERCERTVVASEVMVADVGRYYHAFCSDGTAICIPASALVECAEQHDEEPLVPVPTVRTINNVAGGEGMSDTDWMTGRKGEEDVNDKQLREAIAEVERVLHVHWVSYSPAWEHWRKVRAAVERSHEVPQDVKDTAEGVAEWLRSPNCELMSTPDGDIERLIEYVESGATPKPHALTREMVAAALREPWAGIAMNASGKWYGYKSKPDCAKGTWREADGNTFTIFLPFDIDYDGDPADSWTPRPKPEPKELRCPECGSQVDIERANDGGGDLWSWNCHNCGMKGRSFADIVAARENAEKWQRGRS